MTFIPFGIIVYIMATSLRVASDRLHSWFYSVMTSLSHSQMFKIATEIYQIVFSLSAYTVSEDDGFVELVIIKIPASISENVTLTFSTSDGTAQGQCMAIQKLFRNSLIKAEFEIVATHALHSYDTCEYYNITILLSSTNYLHIYQHFHKLPFMSLAPFSCIYVCSI